MANLFEPLEPCGEGDRSIILSGALWDMMVERVNALCDAQVKPTSNVGTFYTSKSGLILDLISVDDRLRALETGTGIGSVNTIINNSPTTVSITQQISNINARLDAATASVNCVANVAVVTFTI